MEFALGIVKALEATVSTTQLASDLADLGQNLYNPPTVKGWAGGQHWINSTAIVARQNLASALLQGSGPYGNKLNPWAVAQKHGFMTPESTRRFLLDLFLQGNLDSGIYDTLPKAPKGQDDDLGELTRSLAYAIVTLPEFQLA